MGNMIDYVLQQTENYINLKLKSKRKQIGQFFTSKETAIFMASLFDIPCKSDISILDPGSGTGILTAALVERLQTICCIQTIYITCYESNIETAEILNTNLQYIKNNSLKLLEYKIITENYITSQKDDFNLSFISDINHVKYDLVIGNPPYQKIPKEAPEAVAMPCICYGVPNMYFLFASMSLFNLRPNGEMVYIIPRSWTSGAYFGAFRKYFLSEGTLLHIHLFVSRDKVFDNESVLQETIIIKLIKQHDPVATITVTSSKNNKDFDNLTTLEVPYSIIVSDINKYVFLVTTQYELDTLKKLNKLEYTLPSIGLKMKTGLTVDFRNRDLLRNIPDNNSVPIFYSQHIQNGHVIFPVQRDYEYISDEIPGLMQINKNYLFVKRFTSKEEKRRLQSGIYLANMLPEYNKISTQNKINFIDYINGDMLRTETVYGLFVLFNSTIYDLYYRIFNGSTQVNSTEVNYMPMPDMQTINRIGTRLINENNLSTMMCDEILEAI